MAQTTHFLRHNTGLFSICHIWVGQRGVRIFLPAVYLLGMLAGAVACQRLIGLSSWWKQTASMLFVTAIIVRKTREKKNFCLRDPDFAKSLASEYLLGWPGPRSYSTSSAGLQDRLDFSVCSSILEIMLRWTEVNGTVLLVLFVCFVGSLFFFSFFRIDLERKIC